MPIGSYALVMPIIDDMVHAQPKRILDAGIGMGFYGAAVRQWMDAGFKFKTELTGIEGFREYENPCWDLYDQVWVEDIRGVADQLLDNPYQRFDYIIFSDVIEHFPHLEGEEIVRKLVGLLNKGGTLMIGTPAVFCQQGAVHGNDFERHESIWTCDELISLSQELNCGYKVFKNGEPDEYLHCMILFKLTKI